MRTEDYTPAIVELMRDKKKANKNLTTLKAELKSIKVIYTNAINEKYPIWIIEDHKKSILDLNNKIERITRYYKLTNKI